MFRGYHRSELFIDLSWFTTIPQTIVKDKNEISVILLLPESDNITPKTSAFIKTRINFTD